MSCGLAIAWCGPAPGPVLRRALAAAAPGRFVAALWQVSLAWADEPPVEAAALAALMPPPEARSEDASEAVAFHANLAVRTYGADPLWPVRCFQALLVRKAGAKPTARRGESAELEAAARLDTRAPAFTRDWANNVWHLRDAGAERRIVGRLAALLAWPDETVRVFAADGAARTWSRGRASCLDLVAVPERYGPPSA